MKDLTQGSIVSHILNMAPPIVAGMITIMICQLVDLYFVAGLGEAAIAGVAAAGNLGFLINGVDAGAGRRHRRADFACRGPQGSGRRQSGVQPVARPGAAVRAADMGCGLRARRRLYMRMVAADEATVEAGTTYLLWFMPALALQFAVAGDGRRAAGYRHRAAEHDRAGACGDHQHRAGAGPDRRLGHRPCVRRCGCRSCEFDRGPDRRADAVDRISAGSSVMSASIPRSGVRSCGNGSAFSMSACRPAASSRSSSSGWA